MDTQNSFVVRIVNEEFVLPFSDCRNGEVYFSFGENQSVVITNVSDRYTLLVEVGLDICGESYARIEPHKTLEINSNSEQHAPLKYRFSILDDTGRREARGFYEIRPLRAVDEQGTYWRMIRTIYSINPLWLFDELDTKELPFWTSRARETLSSFRLMDKIVMDARLLISSMNEVLVNPQTGLKRAMVAAGPGDSILARSADLLYRCRHPGSQQIYRHKMREELATPANIWLKANLEHVMPFFDSFETEYRKLHAEYIRQLGALKQLLDSCEGEGLQIRYQKRADRIRRYLSKMHGTFAAERNIRQLCEKICRALAFEFEERIANQRPPFLHGPYAVINGRLIQPFLSCPHLSFSSKLLLPANALKPTNELFEVYSFQALWQFLLSHNFTCENGEIHSGVFEKNRTFSFFSEETNILLGCGVDAKGIETTVSNGTSNVPEGLYSVTSSHISPDFFIYLSNKRKGMSRLVVLDSKCILLQSVASHVGNPKKNLFSTASSYSSLVYLNEDEKVLNGTRVSDLIFLCPSDHASHVKDIVFGASIVPLWFSPLEEPLENVLEEALGLVCET